MKQNKYVLPTLSKQTDIGESLNFLNKSFNDFDSFIKKENAENNNISDFVKNIDTIYDKLSFACSLINQNKVNLLNSYTDVAINQKNWLKPINLFYNEKFYNDNNAFSQEYIYDTICKWVQSNYQVKIDEVNKPKYVDGQTANVFYMKCVDTTQEVKKSDQSTSTCLTEDGKLVLNCVTTTTGRACVDACGCVDCGGTWNCKQTKSFTCGFKDKGAPNPKRVIRYLALNTTYVDKDTKDVFIDNVKLIVKDCVWQIDKTIPEAIIINENERVLLLNPAKGIVSFDDNQMVSFGGLNKNGDLLYPF